jgi:hypothetical protein
MEGDAMKLICIAMVFMALVGCAPNPYPLTCVHYERMDKVFDETTPVIKVEYPCRRMIMDDTGMHYEEAK